jgi:serine/threonine-protein kinase RsbW
MTVPNSQNTISIGFAAQQIAARQAIIETVARLQKLGVSPTQCGDIEIALAEAVNNVVEHACADLPGANGFITCQFNDHILIIEISDTGRALPELRLPTGSRTDLSVPLAELPEGGFGWFLIRQIAANVSYERFDGQNRLTLEFITDRKTAPP